MLPQGQAVKNGPSSVIQAAVRTVESVGSFHLARLLAADLEGPVGSLWPRTLSASWCPTHALHLIHLAQATLLFGTLSYRLFALVSLADMGISNAHLRLTEITSAI